MGPKGRNSPPIDPVGAFREAIAAGELDGNSVLEVLAEEGVIDPRALTELIDGSTSVGPRESEMLTDITTVTSDSGPGTGGRFLQVGVLGQGGMGQVIEALDPDLQRKVAVKSLLARAGTSPLLQQKFLAEAQITGQLEHPNIVPIHEMGRRADGEIYFAARFRSPRVRLAEAPPFRSG